MKKWMVFALLALSIAPGTGSAQRRRRGRGTAAATTGTPPAANAGSTTMDLEPPTTATPDADTLTQAIQGAAVGDPHEGSRSIAMLILRGVPPRVAAAGLDALGVLARPEGTAAVIHFLHHRRPSLRRHAIAAAQAIHTPELVRALAGLLADSDEDVRVEAATALGEVGGPEVVAGLIGAFERDLMTVSGPEGGRLSHEAARAIARIGTAEDINHLLSYLRRAPFRTMSDAMRAALSRPQIPDPVKLRVVSSIGDLATSEAREFLQSIVNDAHGQETPVVRAARAAAGRIAN